MFYKCKIQSVMCYDDMVTGQFTKQTRGHSSRGLVNLRSKQITDWIILGLVNSAKCFTKSNNHTKSCDFSIKKYAVGELTSQQSMKSKSRPIRNLTAIVRYR